MYDGKTRKGQTRYLVGYMYRTGGQGRVLYNNGPDAGFMTQARGGGGGGVREHEER